MTRIAFSRIRSGWPLALAAALLVPAFAVPPVAGAQELAAGDAVAGAKVFRKCQACHLVDVEKNKVGPHLVDIVGRPVAALEDYQYSTAMTEYAQTQPEWTEEALAAYLRKPRDVVPKTKMAFAGLKKDEDLANIIAYLKDPSAAE
ncbi:c-type cytochrome [Pseudohoeflea coraliihabitans]|uniref:Cytochrome c family protein n=1 Tax=Pseudohoeflea coraliihabitans TaxID=2860393 RepID=A0ABS6WKG9_9HYPH|nr:cytochrome c family protein [Pseudohoeflea sp. DP4N28-3]MBW3096153.1 cytochrome c family protein [Pseudohoeflea sp. DP4N28-3]